MIRAAALCLALAACGGQAFTAGETPKASETDAPALPSGEAGLDPLADGGSEESVMVGPQTRNDGSSDAWTHPPIVPSDDAGASLQDAGTFIDAGDPAQDAEAEPPPDVIRVEQACSSPASCPSCGVYPRSPCCSASGFCGCEVQQGQCIL